MQKKPTTKAVLAVHTAMAVLAACAAAPLFAGCAKEGVGRSGDAGPERDGRVFDGALVDAGPQDGGPGDAGPRDSETADGGGPDASTPSDGGPGVCGNGILEGNEACDWALHACCNNTCSGPVQANTQCRASAGDCDPAEFCDGAATTCPADLLEPNTTECRPSSGGCDPAEFCTGTSPACPADVIGNTDVGLFAADNATNHNDVQTSLVSTGLLNSVTVGGPVTTGYTPTLAELQQYGAVFVWGSASWDGNAFGNVLADYMDAGGGVVIAVFAQRTGASVGVAGRMDTDNYLPYVPGGYNFTSLTLGTISVPGHPIMNGVSTFGGPNIAFHDDTHNPAATLVASFSNGRPVVAAYQPTVGRSVLLGFYPITTFWDASTDGAVLMANALRWAACGP